MDPIVVKALIEAISGHVYTNEENPPIQWQEPLIGGSALFAPIQLAARALDIPVQQVMDILQEATIPLSVKIAHALLNVISGSSTNYPNTDQRWFDPLIPGGPSPVDLVSAITGVDKSKFLVSELPESAPELSPTPRCASCRQKLHEFNTRSGSTICRRCEVQGVSPPPPPPSAGRPPRPRIVKDLFNQITNNMEFLGDLSAMSRINTTTVKPLLEKFGFDFKLRRRNELLHTLKDAGFVERMGGKRGPTAFFKPTNKLLNLTSEPEESALETTEAPIEIIPQEVVMGTLPEIEEIEEIEERPSVPLTVLEADRAPTTPYQDELNIENRYTLRLEVSPKDQRHIFKDLRFASKVVGRPLAGSFIKWAGIGEIFRDDEFFDKFLNKLTAHIDTNEEGWANFEIEYSEPVGWADTVPLEWLPENIVFHPKRILNKKTGTTTVLQVVEDHSVPGPETTTITVGVNIRNTRNGKHVNIIRLYPGPFVGAITISEEAGQSPAGTLYVFLAKEPPYPPGDTQGFWPSVLDAKQREETSIIEKQQEQWNQQKQIHEADIRDLVLLALNEESDPVTIEQLAENSGLNVDDVRQALPEIQNQITQARGTYILNTKITATPSPTPTIEVAGTPIVLQPLFGLGLSSVQQVFIRPNHDIVTEIVVKTDAGDIPLVIVIPGALGNTIKNFRCSGQKAGNFLVYKDIREALAKDPVLWNALSNRLQALLRKQVHTSGRLGAQGIEVDFTLNHQNLIGWSDNIPTYFIDQMKDVQIDRKVNILSRVFTGREPSRRPNIQADIVSNVAAPLTNLVTFHGGLVYNEDKGSYVFHVRDIYPGQSLGNLTEGPFNLAQRNVCLFDLEALGEDITNRTTSSFIEQSITDLRKRMEKEWVSSKVSASKFADQIKMPLKMFEQEILRPISLTPGHKQISILTGKDSEIKTKSPKNKKPKGPSTNRKILFIGGNQGIGGLRPLQAYRDWLTKHFYFEEVEGGGGAPLGNLPSRQDWDLIIVFTGFTGHPMVKEIKNKYPGITMVSAAPGGAGLKGLPAALVAAEKQAPWLFELAMKDQIIDKKRWNPLRGAELCDLVERSKEYLHAEYNVQFLDYLGAGRDGCVYRYDANKVIKFSTSTKEAKFAAYLSSAKHVAGFPKVTYVDRIKLPNTSKSIYVIIKEDIPSIQLPDIIFELIIRLCEIASPTKTVEAISDQLYAYLDHVFKGSVSDPNLNESSELLLHHFADFIIWCAEHYIYIVDVSRRNIGIRTEGSTHSLVIRDFSYCEVVE